MRKQKIDFALLEKMCSSEAANTLRAFMESDLEKKDEGAFQDNLKIIAKSMGMAEAENDIALDINGFTKNVTLILNKTWSGERDFLLKEEVLRKLKIFSQKDGEKDFSLFLDIAKGVVNLLFGEVSKSDMFIEYVFRIDEGIGMFCVFLELLTSAQNLSFRKTDAAMRLLMYFLTNY